jgi:hypothetical protein
MKINVTQEDIDLGKPRCPWDCPIARAVQRQTRDEAYRVLPGLVYKWDDNSQAEMLPPEACEFIQQFDGNGKASVKPFSFETKPLGRKP